MNHCYFKAAKLYIDLAEADDNLKEVTEVRELVRWSEGTGKGMGKELVSYRWKGMGKVWMERNE